MLRGASGGHGPGGCAGRLYPDNPNSLLPSLKTYQEHPSDSSRGLSQEHATATGNQRYEGRGSLPLDLLFFPD